MAVSFPIPSAKGGHMKYYQMGLIFLVLATAWFWFMLKTEPSCLCHFTGANVTNQTARFDNVVLTYSLTGEFLQRLNYTTCPQEISMPAFTLAYSDRYRLDYTCEVVSKNYT